MLALPNQIPNLCELCDLTRNQVDWELWVVAPNDERWHGPAGINRVLEELGGVYRWIGAAYHFPPIRWIENKVYRWVAGHRPFLSRIWGAPPEWNE